MKKRILTVACALALLTGLLPGCGSNTANGGTVTVLDANGDQLARLQMDADLQDREDGAYLQIALTEAAQALAQINGSTQQDALKQLFADGCTLSTAFDPAVFSAVTTAFADGGTGDAGCAVTDLMGNLLAAYSTGNSNFAAAKTAPYSAFKPLSVYLPAIESGKVNWFTSYEDTPYKQLAAEDGTLQDWPQNASGTYSGEQTPVYKALRRSLNTVAVRCLAQVGVNKAIAFLQENFGIPLEEEAYAAETMGEEEVIGNIALGYLETGVSPVDMAGYYQIFGNGGIYTQPRAVRTVTNAADEVLWQWEPERRQVTSAAAADIMNKLLQEVITADGTGSAAFIKGVEVAGKTGTGDGNSGNWFVGLIPGYSCAVWHGQAESNRAAALFGTVMEGVFAADKKQQTEFYAHDIIDEVICCAESGSPVSKGCKSIALGYFLTGEGRTPCKIHP